MTVGLFAGSFDPITNGHVELISRAANLFDTVYVVLAVNADKKYLLSEAVRHQLIHNVLHASLTPEEWDRIVIATSVGELLIDFAVKNKVTHLVRGLRNAQDFNYEEGMRLFNESINPAIQTVYMALPANMALVSSSLVRSLIGLSRWKRILEPYVHTLTLKALNHSYKVRMNSEFGLQSAKAPITTIPYTPPAKRFASPVRDADGKCTGCAEHSCICYTR